ncbi:tyrosine-type recombinase/integrase [Actinomadura sp. 9N407]|uniref:tyrosine-type recombinase/integrase n=1 Tax=Actinomadura sp. 9N407 TaxID=3375154 RepID=UPI00378BD7C1
MLAACPPKTASSSRVIALDRTTVRALRDHRERQQRECQETGPGYCDSGYVFTAANGDPLAPDRLTRLLGDLIAEQGLPPIGLHDLRHGAATLALAAGVELKVVQDMLGHSSVVLTADTYTSVLPEVAHRAAKKTAAHVMKKHRLVPGSKRRAKHKHGAGRPKPPGPGCKKRRSSKSPQNPVTDARDKPDASAEPPAAMLKIRYTSGPAPQGPVPR